MYAHRYPIYPDQQTPRPNPHSILECSRTVRPRERLRTLHRPFPVVKTIVLRILGSLPQLPNVYGRNTSPREKQTCQYLMHFLLEITYILAQLQQLDLDLAAADLWSLAYPLYILDIIWKNGRSYPCDLRTNELKFTLNRSYAYFRNHMILLSPRLFFKSVANESRFHTLLNPGQ